MKEHYNLYYLFQEDQKQHPLPAHRSEAVRKNIEKFFESVKPPPNSQPLISRGQKTLEQ